MRQVIVDKGRVTTLSVSLGYDVSADSFASEIREEPRRDSPLIATWQVRFKTDGTDGELVLSLDDSSNSITKSVGYMDVKRITGGKPVPVWNTPLEVSFQETVTV